MIATEESKTGYLTDLRELIAHGGQGVSVNVLSSRKLREMTIGSTDWDYGAVDMHELSGLLRQLGYSKFPSRVKVNQESHNVWFKDASLSDDEVRTAFRVVMEKQGATIADHFDKLGE